MGVKQFQTVLVVAILIGGTCAVMEDQPSWTACMAAPSTCLMLEVYGPNSVDGTIPTEIGLLTALQRLTLYNAKVSGTIPEEIGALRDLTALNFHNNFIVGQIPTTIGNLTKLVQIYGYNNKLDGTLPEEIAQLTDLESLFLSTNQIKGTIPSGYGNLTNMYQFSLHANNLTGTIPTELGKLYKSLAFFLSKNELTGSVPDEVLTMVGTGAAKWSVCGNLELTMAEPFVDPHEGIICDRAMHRRLLSTSAGFMEHASSHVRTAALVASLGLALVYSLL